MTEAGALLGTLQYMAPEQIEGRPADARTDIFAFGAVLYEMLTGRRAFEGASTASRDGRDPSGRPALIASARAGSHRPSLPRQGSAPPLPVRPRSAQRPRGNSAESGFGQRSLLRSHNGA